MAAKVVGSMSKQHAGPVVGKNIPICEQERCSRDRLAGTKLKASRPEPPVSCMHAVASCQLLFSSALSDAECRLVAENRSML